MTTLVFVLGVVVVVVLVVSAACFVVGLPPGVGLAGAWLVVGFFGDVVGWLQLNGAAEGIVVCGGMTGN